MVSKQFFEYLTVFNSDLNQKTIVNLLLSNGANVNKQDARGLTPLHISLQRNNLEVTHLLLQHPGINTSLKDHAGNTALHFLARCVNNNTADISLLFELIISNGGEVEAMNKQGDTPLHWVAKYGKTCWY